MQALNWTEKFVIGFITFWIVRRVIISIASQVGKILQNKRNVQYTNTRHQYYISTLPIVNIRGRIIHHARYQIPRRAHWRGLRLLYQVLTSAQREVLAQQRYILVRGSHTGRLYRVIITTTYTTTGNIERLAKNTTWEQAASGYQNAFVTERYCAHTVRYVYGDCLATQVLMIQHNEQDFLETAFKQTPSYELMRMPSRQERKLIPHLLWY